MVRGWVAEAGGRGAWFASVPAQMKVRAAAMVCAFGLACGSVDQDPPANVPRGFGLDACFADVTAPETGFVEILTLVSTDPALRVRLARRPGDGAAVGETFAFELVRFGYEDEQTQRCIKATERLSYRYGHHNWDDEATVIDEDREYLVTMKYLLTAEDARWADALTIRAPGGAVIAGPINLRDGGCRSLPYDLNPCFRRMRTDSP